MKKQGASKPSIYRDSSPLEISTYDNPILILKVDTGEEQPKMIKLYHQNDIPLVSQSFAAENALDEESLKKIEAALHQACSNLNMKRNKEEKSVSSQRGAKSSPQLKRTTKEGEMSPRKLAQGYARFPVNDSTERSRVSGVKPANYGERMYIKGAARKEDSM